MFRMSALLFVGIIGIQLANIAGSSQDELGAGHFCKDFIEYGINCPSGPGNVCENNTYDGLGSYTRCHALMESINADPARDASGDCDNYEDANRDPCPFPVPFDGNYYNSNTGCTHIPCVKPL